MLTQDDIMAILLVAVDTGDVSLAREAIGLGADPNGVVAREPALHHAILRLQGQTGAEMVTALCTSGAMPDLDFNGRTPLLLALQMKVAAEDGLPVVDALLAAGAAVNGRMSNGALPLLFAVAEDIRHDTDWRTRRLLDAGANPDAQAAALPDKPNVTDTIRMYIVMDATDDSADVTPQHRNAALRLLALLPPSPDEQRRQALDAARSNRFKLKGPAK